MGEGDALDQLSLRKIKFSGRLSSFSSYLASSRDRIVEMGFLRFWKRKDSLGNFATMFVR
jgi:hypothetical protein